MQCQIMRRADFQKEEGNSGDVETSIFKYALWSLNGDFSVTNDSAGLDLAVQIILRWSI